MGDPAVSCMCLTFARPRRILEEAVHSFLSQDYPGPKELVILNDFNAQSVRFDHPQVTVINVPSRFRTVGEKRNAAAALCRYDLLAVWDDDDVYLPHRLSFSVARYDKGKRFFKPSRAFVLNNGVVTGPKANLFHSGGMWHRSLFDDVGGYRHMGSGQDMDIEIRFEKIIGRGKNYDEIKPSEIFYLYRWGGTQSYHLSAFGPDRAGVSGNDRVMAYVQQHLRQGKLQLGEVRLSPCWSVDYSRLVREYAAKLANAPGDSAPTPA